MIRRARLLAGLLALSASVATAEAQSVNLTYQQRSPRAARAVLPRTYRVAPRRIWVAGRYERVRRRVWVGGGYRREWAAPVHGTRIDSCGRPVTILIRKGYWNLIEQPGHFETRWVQVWVDGYRKTIR